MTLPPHSNALRATKRRREPWLVLAILALAVSFGVGMGVAAWL